MLFPTHLLAAALLGRWSRFAPQWLVVGAAAPDVIDKPLASFGFVELFHSVGHSALFAVVLLPLALRDRRGRAVFVGWASHLFLDAAHIVVNGRPDDALFLGWPLVEPATPLAIPPGSFFLYYLWSPSFYVEVVIWTVALGLLVRERSIRAVVGAE